MTVGDRRITAEDVWALLAIAYVASDDRGAEAHAIRGLSGAIPCAPLADEGHLRASLDRLIDAGLVVEADGLHRPAGAIAAFLRARTHRRGVWHDYRDLVRHLEL